MEIIKSEIQQQVEAEVEREGVEKEAIAKMKKMQSLIVGIRRGTLSREQFESLPASTQKLYRRAHGEPQTLIQKKNADAAKAKKKHKAKAARRSRARNRK